MISLTTGALPPYPTLDGARSHLEVLLESLPAGAYMCDAEGIIRYYNGRAAELWGRAPLIGDERDRYCGSFRLYASDGTPIDHANCWMARALRERRSFNGEEVQIERPNGERLAALAYVNPIYDATGKLIGAVNVLVDISDRTRVENEVRRVSHALQTLVEASPLPIVVIDPEPPIVRLWNPAAEKLFGWSASEVIGRRIPIVPEAMLDECRRYRSMVARGRTFSGSETYRLAKSGASVQVALSAAPMRDANGIVTGVLLQFVDITERKRAEDALHRADCAKNEFLATLAHELRNPLTPIRTAAEVLNMILDDSADADVRIAIDVIDRQMRQMTRLIDDLLDVARITANRLSLRRERMSLNDAITVALEACRPLIDERNQRIDVTLPYAPVLIDGDPARIAQVVSNLLDNASRYSPMGATIDLRLDRAGSTATMIVRDNGTGIAPEMLPHIFEMFSQGTYDNSRPRSGLGVGLSLVRRIVEKHGGSVVARSEGPGRGSEFVVTLPALEGPASAANAGNGRGRERIPSSQRILVVDDNRDSAEILAQLLRMAGAEVRTAHDGIEAFELAAQFVPHIALLDIGLPTIDGHELARRIRSTEWGRSMTLIAVTGWGQTEDQQRSADAGFDHHLVKPVDPVALIAMLAASR